MTAGSSWRPANQRAKERCRIMGLFMADGSASRGALDSLSCFVHGDAVGMGNDVPFRLRERRRSGHIYKAVRRALVPWERRGREGVKHGYHLTKYMEFATAPSRCVQMACRMDLFTRARKLGIQTEFVDGQGHRHVTDAAALKIILDALPVRAPYRFLRDAVVIRSGHPARTELKPAAKLPLHWKIVGGGGIIAQGQADDRQSDAGNRTIVWPDGLPEGSYRLHLTDASSFSEEAPLIVAPPKAYRGDFDRGWLMAVQLYGVRSRRNWGIGDFTDLEALIELAGHLGADGVGLNPLHALFDDRPADCSPYSPNSRLFLNALYIDVEAIPEYRSGIFVEAGDTIAGLRAGNIVDYTGVAELKWRALRAVFQRFRTRASAGRKRDFEKFRTERAPLLSRFACFEVLRHKFNKPWWEWPEQWRQPDEANCAALRQGPDAAEIEFVEFVQWTADRQLQSCAERAVELGMKVGLYLDVAVGVQSDGFDAWNEQVAISHHLAVRAA